MASVKQTQLLILLLIASGIAAAMAWSRLSDRRDSAIAAQRDLQLCSAELELMSTRSGGMPAHSPAHSLVTADDIAVNRRLRSAAIAAHLSDQLASVEPGTPLQLRNSDYTQTPIYVRLNAVSLRQLVGFLHSLSSADRGLRTTDIELSPALVSASPTRQDASETWTADVTVSYLALTEGQNSAGRPPAAQ